MYHLPLENALCGIRFQPIYSVAEQEIKAWEVLSLLQPNINTEVYFSAQPDSVYLNILLWQLKLIYHVNNRKRYYLNIPARLLCSLQAVEKLLPWLREGIVLEVQDPQSFISLSRSERLFFYCYTRIIKSTGAEVWLDDILPEQANNLSVEMARFDGVKIDKSVLLKPSALSPLITHCARHVKFVLVEGVENNEHFTIAKEGGSDFLQGYMWQEEQLFINYIID
ncbi:EAL domain-containing protein (plasmid) [Enterobacter sp. JS8-1]|uniref:EAL domain-containing protein n=1 Tax=Enterobacter sp. JS8-1 TaxID=3411633 RepID=UPI003BA1B827